MLRPRQKLGKYRIVRRLCEGSFANVYEALDTIEGVRVALKLPHEHLTTESFLEDFRQEVRLTAKLDHALILPVKNADFIDGKFTVVTRLGDQTLADRMRYRMTTRRKLELIEQMVEAVAHAHRVGIIHCDVKPENFILFGESQVRLTDFGIAKLSRRTMRGSGSGTVGYVAPEQAMGRPSRRSDVFSLGLIAYRMLTGVLPEWPYDTPLPGEAKLRGPLARLRPWLRRALRVKPQGRFADAGQMLTAFRRIRPTVAAPAGRGAGRGRGRGRDE